MGTRHDGFCDPLSMDITEAQCGVGDSGQVHQVGTFSISADDLHIEGIFQVIHERDCPVTWNTNVYRSERNPRFTTHFCKGFQKAMGTQLTMSIVFHP